MQSRLGYFSSVALVIAFGGLGSLSARAEGLELTGRWWTPLGVMKFSQKGVKVTGIVSWKCKVCPFKRGEKVLKGVLLEDSLSGRVRYCLKGKQCNSDGWAPLVMLVAREGRVLSGAAYFKPTKCRVGGKGKKDGIVMRKLRRKPKKPKPKPKPKDLEIPEPPDPGKAAIEDKDGPMEAEVEALDPRAYRKNSGTWQANMEAGAQFMGNGFFERARRKFRQAIDLDPTRPEAFNGIGVTYYARHDHEEALRWYKKSLEVNPDFGDAYYNMACIYSLKKKPNLAFRYLNIAALNGFIQPRVLAEDPDLNNLRSDSRYKKLMRKMRKRAG